MWFCGDPALHGTPSGYAARTFSLSMKNRIHSGDTCPSPRLVLTPGVEKKIEASEQGGKLYRDRLRIDIASLPNSIPERTA